MLDYIDPKEDERILDIACGVGVFSLKIAERGCEVHAIDISEEWIKHSKRLSERERIACEFVVGSAEDLPYPNNYFDKVVCSSSLEHFKDDIKALKEMNRVLKVNGKLVLTTDSFTYPISEGLKEWHSKMYHVVNYYTHEKLKERFEIAGFTMTQSKYLLNSRITSFFFNYLILKDHFILKARLHGILGMMIHLIAYPLCLLSDNLFGVRDKGYTLIAEGKKINSSKEP